MSKKILILKNDRGGDLLNSIKCVSSLINENSHVTIFLSKFNYGFSFLFNKATVKKINYNLNILDKIKIFFFLINNKFDEIYILTPKNYYYFLPIFFNKVKFFALTINGKKRNRPSIYIRKFLYKYVTIDRNIINKKSSSQLQLDLIEDKSLIDNDLKNITLPILNNFIKVNIPKDFLFVQYKNNFFNKIDLSNENFDLLLNALKKKYKFIVFSSDIENNSSNIFFYNRYTVIDCTKKIIDKKGKDSNIIYLHSINSEDLLSIIGVAKNIISPHGLVTQMCNFHNKKSINLFNFVINNNEDFKHQKISFSEWYKNMNINFLFLNKNINKSIKKILKNI